MTALKFIDRIERIHFLIRRGGTGSPKELASRLNLSESMVYEYIKTLKALGAPLMYDADRQSYIYEKPCSLNLSYQMEELDSEEMMYAEAGLSMSDIVILMGWVHLDTAA